MRAYADALLSDPLHRPSLLALGETLLAFGRPEAAVRVYRHVDQLFPGDPEVRMLLAEALSSVRGEDPDAARTEPVTPSPLPAAPSAPPVPEPPNATVEPALSSAGSKPQPASTPPRPAHLRAGPALIAPRFSRSAQLEELQSRTGLIGAIAFVLLLATYVMVAIATHWAIGLAAAVIVGLTIAAAGSLFFSGSRWLAFTSILRGELIGITLTLLVGLISLVIAILSARDAAF